MAFRIGLITFMTLALAGLSVAADDGYKLELEYLFDEDEGHFVKDTSGNEYYGIAYRGVLEGGEWVEGRKGKAIYFDGKESFVKLPDAVLGGAPQAGRMEFWMKPEELKGNVFAKWATGWGGFWIQLRADGSLRFVLQGDGVSSTSRTPEAAIPVNEWTLVEVRWDSEDGNAIYVNSEQAGVSEPVEWQIPGAYATTMGCQKMSGFEPRGFYRGALDEFRIFVREKNR